MGLHRLSATLVLLGAITHAASYFLPYESQSWSPLRMAQGYCAAGGFLRGWEVGLFESASYACGLIVALAFFLRRRPTFASSIVLTYLLLWTALAVLYGVRFFHLPAIQFPSVWAGMAGGFLCALIALAFFQVHRWGTPQGVIQLALFAAGVLVVYQPILMAYVRLEDGLLLNYGAVTSAVGAVVLFLALLFHRQATACTPAPSVPSDNPVT